MPRRKRMSKSLRSTLCKAHEPDKDVLGRLTSLQTLSMFASTGWCCKGGSSCCKGGLPYVWSYMLFTTHNNILTMRTVSPFFTGKHPLDSTQCTSCDTQQRP